MPPAAAACNMAIHYSALGATWPRSTTILVSTSTPLCRCTVSSSSGCRSKDNTKRAPDAARLGKLPRWLGQVYDLDLPEHVTTLIRVLQDQSRQKRVPMMAPEPPPDFVQRAVEFEALKRQLLDAKGDAV